MSLGEDGARSPSLARVMMNHVAAALDFVRVALPGRVDEYDATTQRAQVQPLIQHGEVIEGVRVTRTLPPILDVPVMFPGSGAYRITWPVARGDIVLLVFSSSSISRWLAHVHDDKPVDPGDDSRHNLSDGVAIPGLYNFANLPPTPNTSGVEIHSSSTIRCGGDQPLVTRAEFLAHCHATAGTGTPSGPISGASPPGSSVTFPGTDKLRG